MTDQEFGEAIGLAMDGQGFTPKDVAAAVGVTPAYIRMLRKGQRTAASNLQQRILLFLKVPHTVTLTERTVLYQDLEIELER